MEIIKVKCRKCGKLARSDEMVLDSFYKLVVCPACVKEKQIKESVLLKPKLEEKPVDWDRDDKLLERPKVEIQKLKFIQDKDGIYICPKCSYKFRCRNTPNRCPYCDGVF